MKLSTALLLCAALPLGYLSLTEHGRLTAARPVEVELEGPVKRVLDAEAPAGFVVRSLAIEGMCCSGCTGKLAGRLAALDEVQDFAVDFASSSAQALVAREVEVGVLEEALTFDKYVARSVRP